jgi:hypothetical protein
MECAMKQEDKYKPQSNGHIDANNRFELEYWCKKLGVGRDELRWAVQAAGPRCTDVAAALRSFFADRFTRASYCLRGI